VVDEQAASPSEVHAVAEEGPRLEPTSEEIENAGLYPQIVLSPVWCYVVHSLAYKVALGQSTHHTSTRTMVGEGDSGVLPWSPPAGRDDGEGPRDLH